MGFLESLGRSGFQPDVRGFLALQRQQEQDMIAAEDRQRKIDQQDAEAKAEQERLNRRIHLPSDPVFNSLPEEEKGKQIQFFGKAGQIDDNGAVSVKDIEARIGEIESSEKLFGELSASMTRQARKNLEKANEKMLDLQNSGADPKSIDTQAARVKTLQDKLRGVEEAGKKHMPKAGNRQQQAEPAQEGTIDRQLQSIRGVLGGEPIDPGLTGVLPESAFSLVDENGQLPQENRFAFAKELTFSPIPEIRQLGESIAGSEANRNAETRSQGGVAKSLAPQTGVAKAAFELNRFVQNGGDLNSEEGKLLQQDLKDAGKGKQTERSLATDKNINTTELAFEIETLKEIEKNRELTKKEQSRLAIATNTQDRAATLIPGLRAAAVVTAKDKAFLKQIIKPDKRGRTLDPNTFASVPEGTTNQEADDIGAVLATPTQMKGIAELGKVKGIVDVLGTLATKAITAKTAAEALKEGAKSKLGAIAKSNAVAAAYVSEREAFLGTLARELGGEKGVLTDQDIKRIKAAFPSLRDTAEIANFKIATIRFFIENAEFAKKQQIFGLLDDGAYTARKEKLFENLEAFREIDVSTQVPSQPPTTTKQQLNNKFNIELE